MPSRVPEVTTRRSRAPSAAIAAALAVLTVAAFFPVRHNGFILYDDPAYVTRNEHVVPGLTPEGAAWAFTGAASDNWHPLTWLSHMLDVSLFGMDPGAHHLVSVALHAAGAALLFLTLAAMTGSRWRCALAAALFAVHPLRVESVAWAAERKDVLSGLFFVLTLAAYLRYARRPGPGRYAAVAACLALGLLAKQTLVTLPLVLLLLDWWPLGRLAAGGRPAAATGARLLAEKAPLIALSAAAGAVTFAVQRASGAVKGAEQIPLVPRLFNAVVSCVRYLGDAAWPLRLSPVHPHPGPDLAVGAVLASLAALVAATLVARGLARTRPWLAAGWAWYLVTLLPVIGIVQVGWQGRADRYTYLPLTGVFLALSWEAARLARGGRARAALAAVSVALVATLAALTWRQTGFWRDSVTLFSRAVAVEPGNLMARELLGKAQRVAGDPAAAVDNLRAAKRINPRRPGVDADLGLALLGLGDFAGAAGAFERALQLDPETAAAHNNLGYALLRAGQPRRALAQFEAALRIAPGYGRAHANAAAALELLGRGAEAAEHLRQAAARGGPP
jgi:tetratricopeptide (TPR) repeat protein